VIVIFGPVADIRLWTSRLVVTSQKRATDTQETAETTNKHASWDEQTHGPLPWGNEINHQQKQSSDTHTGCSESRLLLSEEADLPLSECGLYRQNEQARHSRWRGWMLRPRVIRSPTNLEWEVAGSSPTLRSVLFLHFYCCLFFSSSAFAKLPLLIILAVYENFPY